MNKALTNTKNVPILLFVLVTLTSYAQGAFNSNIFDDDHDFMKGFETGIMMRSKKGNLEDFGCAIPEDSQHDLTGIIDNISNALNTVKAFVPK